MPTIKTTLRKTIIEAQLDTPTPNQTTQQRRIALAYLIGTLKPHNASTIIQWLDTATPNEIAYIFTGQNQETQP